MDRSLELEGLDRELIAEQKLVQSEKSQSRLADDYNRRIFLGGVWIKDRRTSEVEEFIKTAFGSQATSLEGILGGLVQRHGGKVRWVEMGGGTGLVMRQMALLPTINSQVDMINVDIFDPDLSGLEAPDLKYLEQKYPGILADTVRPAFIKGNISTIQLPQPANLVTSVEVMQYLDHPIAALCNWYNQLADHGILIVSTEHEWSRGARYEGVHYIEDPHPTTDMLKILATNNIAFAVSDESYKRGRRSHKYRERPFRNLVIQKRPDTFLNPTSSVTKIWYNPFHYKAVYYQADTPPIQVLKGISNVPSLSERYKSQLANTVRERQHTNF